MRRALLLWGVMGLAALGVAGCGNSAQDELNDWMREQRQQVKPRVTPITEPKKFTPQAYTQAERVEPFSNVKLTQALRKDTNQSTNSSLIAPELARRKEALEAFPLDAMAMVGSLNQKGRRVALVTVDKLLYQVQVGNHLGMNYGRVTEIGETQLKLREIVQDAAGEWIEREASLQLQEKSK